MLKSRCRSLALVLASLLAMVLVGTASPAWAAEPAPRLDWSASIDGRDVKTINRDKPLELAPETPAVVTVTVTNQGQQPVEVRSVRLTGRVMGMAFFVYSTRVDMQLQPGGGDERQYVLDFEDLDGQATGLIPASLILRDPDGEALDSQDFPVNVRGRLRSVYGTFGLAVAAITVVLVVGALRRLASGRLPLNRWRRATTLATPGLGVGMTLTFTLSALRVLVPAPGTWLSLVAVGGALGFLAGYLSPTPEEPAVGEEPAVEAEPAATDQPAEAETRSSIDLREAATEPVSQAAPSEGEPGSDRR